MLDLSALKNPIDARELFRNSGSGDLGYGDDDMAGPFGVFKSNLFSSRTHLAQESLHKNLKSRQQFREITLKEATPTRQDESSAVGNNGRVHGQNRPAVLEPPLLRTQILSPLSQQSSKCLPIRLNWSLVL